MQIDVFFQGSAASPSDVSGRVVLVIDVLRASTSIAVALHHGARAVIPFASVEDAITRSRSLDRRDILLAGERRMEPVAGFDLGNSPAEFSADVVAGKTVLMTTSNGTSALAGTAGASNVVAGAYVNYSSVLAFLRAAVRGGKSIAIVCAGSNGRFALEDAACAGRYVRGVARRGLNPDLGDAARVAAMIDRRLGGDIEALLRASDHGQALVAAGFGDDLAVCAGLNTHPTVPVALDRQLVRLGAGRGR